jgi:hypothetical protein
VEFVRTATEQPGEATARIRISAILRTVVLGLALAEAEDTGALHTEGDRLNDPSDADDAGDDAASPTARFGVAPGTTGTPIVTETNVSPAFFAWNQTHVDLDAPPPFRSAACVNRPVTDCDRRGVAASISLPIMTAIHRPERRSPQVALSGMPRSATTSTVRGAASPGECRSTRAMIQSDASHCSRALPRSDSGRRTLMRHFGEIVATMQSQCRNGFGVVTR